LDQDIQDIINAQTDDPTYRPNEFVPSRKENILAKNKIIRHRNKLVRQARENGKFYLEGGVLSMQ